jgi:hypothetical protein
MGQNPPLSAASFTGEMNLRRGGESAMVWPVMMSLVAAVRHFELQEVIIILE